MRYRLFSTFIFTFGLSQSANAACSAFVSNFESLLTYQHIFIGKVLKNTRNELILSNVENFRGGHTGRITWKLSDELSDNDYPPEKLIVGREYLIGTDSPLKRPPHLFLNICDFVVERDKASEMVAKIASDKKIGKAPQDANTQRLKIWEAYKRDEQRKREN